MPMIIIAQVDTSGTVAAMVAMSLISTELRQSRIRRGRSRPSKRKVRRSLVVKPVWLLQGDNPSAGDVIQRCAWFPTVRNVRTPTRPAGLPARSNEGKRRVMGGAPSGAVS
jgi:hypothetical protein